VDGVGLAHTQQNSKLARKRQFLGAVVQVGLADVRQKVQYNQSRQDSLHEWWIEWGLQIYNKTTNLPQFVRIADQVGPVDVQQKQAPGAQQWLRQDIAWKEQKGRFTDIQQI
jgi:hypothetical protein